MSLELVKEAFRVNNLLGEDTIQEVIENDIIVPDTKPDIARVLLLDGDVFVTGCDTGTDRVVTSGCVVCKILYISDDEARSVKSILSNIPFSYTIDVPGVRSGMKCKTKGMLEHLDYNLLNGRKINVKAILSLNCKAYEEIEKEYSANVSGLDDVQVLKDNFLLNSYLGSNKVNYVIKEDMELPSSKPSIGEILKSDVKITGKDYKITEGKVIVKGDVAVATLYTADDENRSLQYVENEVAFTQFIDLDGVNEDTMVDVDYDLIDYKIDAVEDADGELRNIRADVNLNIYVEGTNTKTAEVMADAYSPKAKILLEKNDMELDELFAENRSQIVIKDVVNLADYSPDVSEIFNVMSRYNTSDIRIEDEKVVIEGSVQNNLLYMANNDEQPLFCCKKDIPFKHDIEIKGINKNMKPNVSLELEHSNYSMITSDQVEIRVVIGVNTKVDSKKKIPVINKVNEGMLDEKKMQSMPSVVIYITQPGDSLWKIAKKYGTTVDVLIKINNMSDRDVLTVGQQILVLKRAV